MLEKKALLLLALLKHWSAVFLQLSFFVCLDLLAVLRAIFAKKVTALLSIWLIFVLGGEASCVHLSDVMIAAGVGRI